MRAPGNVQGTFAFEQMIDTIAEKIGMDPIEFRKINYTDVDPDWGGKYTSKKLIEAYDQGAKAIGWEKRNKPGSGEGTVKRGIGMASQIWWGGGSPPGYATLKLNSDGSLNISSGTQDIGTGTYTILAQVASEILEIPMDKIQVTLGDTETGPYGTASGGSMTAPTMTPAVYDAAVQMMDKLKSGAAAILEVSEDELNYSNGIFTVKNDPQKTIDISKIVNELNARTLVTTGARNANPDGYAINTFGAQFADVEVDTETGKIKVNKIVAAHDIGRAINPMTLNNQIHGGVIQGLGFALFEERIMDSYTGKTVNANFHDYKVPTIKDTPEIVPIIVSETDTLISPVGAKGVGEPAIIPTAAAISNAVYNAIGVRIKSAPMTPDKVLNAINNL